jgi:hypothetical protein
VCGPAGFLAEINTALAAFGVAPEQVHFEIFKRQRADDAWRRRAAMRIPHVPKDDANTGQLVSFARSGIAAHWNASAYQSILGLAEECDVAVRWSCRTGCVIAVRAAWSRENLSTGRSTSPPAPASWSAAHNRLAMSLSTCEASSFWLCCRRRGVGFGVAENTALVVVVMQLRAIWPFASANQQKNLSRG